MKYAAKQGKVNQLLDGNKQFEEMHKKAIILQREIAKQRWNQDEKLGRFVNSCDRVQRGQNGNYEKK